MSTGGIDHFNEVTMKQSALKIILVDENMGRSAILRRALQDKGPVSYTHLTLPTNREV